MDAHLEPQALADLICTELDPVMTANGFQAGQSGVGDDIGIIYCAPHVEFRRRFPGLGPTIQYDDAGACTDLNIYAGMGVGGRLHEIRFDGVTLHELLAEEGIEYASEADAIAALPAAAGVVRLRSVLSELFSRHATARPIRGQQRVSLVGVGVVANLSAAIRGATSAPMSALILDRALGEAAYAHVRTAQ
ncbi:hypothetical protein MRBLWH7_002349 [Microbacterium sp. LWH7-1.2]|uniref:hypothetical protein n=1 Tax=Microbacterium sp. LWH7-1.2 TaxID=3135257 RepID=UPI003138EBA7